MAEDNVLIDIRDDGIAFITMNRPDIADASVPEVCHGVADAVRELNKNPDVRVIILTGNGRAFSAGGDLKAMLDKRDMFGGSPNDIRNRYRSIIHDEQLAIYRSDVPVIAAVNGAAAGAGNDLVAVCDIAIASDKAKFQETFVSIGLISGDGGSWLLPRVIGKTNAFLMAYTADWFSADEVQKMGLVHKVVPHDDLLEETLALAKRIARHPNGAVRATRRLIIEGGQSSFEAALDQCASIQGGMHFTPEHREKVIELMDKLEAKRKEREAKK